MTAAADELREEVRRRYAESANALTEGGGDCDCGTGACCADDSAASAVASTKFG